SVLGSQDAPVHVGWGFVFQSLLMGQLQGSTDFENPTRSITLHKPTFQYPSIFDECLGDWAKTEPAAQL
ncbi:MAG: hypothetical protein ABSD88_05820, partial [Candidatus Korobacteraceae bacterium]